MPPGAAIALMLVGVVARAGWRTIQHARARDAEIAARAADGPTIVIGRDYAGRAVEIPERTLAAHGLILGATGAGKSTTLLTLLSTRSRAGDRLSRSTSRAAPGSLRSCERRPRRPLGRSSSGRPTEPATGTRLPPETRLSSRTSCWPPSASPSRTTAVPPSAICSWRSRWRRRPRRGEPLTLTGGRRADGARAPRRREQAHCRRHAPSTSASIWVR